MESTSNDGQRGVSLTEVMVALAVTAIVGTGAAPSMQRLLDARRHEGVAQQLAADIRAARAEAIARNDTLRVSLHGSASAGCYVVHTGPAVPCSCAGTGAAVCTGGAVVLRTARWSASDGVSLAANVPAIAFDALHGTATPAGTIKVTGRDGRAVHHVVNVMGRLRTCSPHGEVPGTRPC